MKKYRKIISMLLLICLLCTACYASSTDTQRQLTGEKKEYESVFEGDKIIDINIELSDEDWQSILDNPKAEEFKSANVTVDGVTVENVGFRTKGNSSLNSVSGSDSERYSFKIKFDKYVKKQRLMDLDELALNSNFADPSSLREYLSYEALRSIGSTVPLCVFANIYINGELKGLYLCVEAEDDAFLERNFGNNDGNLYKQEMGSSLLYEEGSDYPNSELKNGPDTEKTGLKNMIQVLNEMPDGEKGEIESVLDVDSALQYIAANTVLGNYDSYNGSMLHNYYLYEHDGKFYVIPWDYNMSFGGFMGSSSAAAAIPIDEPVFGVSMDKTPLITNLLEVPEYKERYYGYIRQLLEYLEGFEDRVAELANLIRPALENDPTKFYTMEQFESSITYNENQTSDNEMPAMSGGQENGQMPGSENFPGGNGEIPQMQGQMPEGFQPSDMNGEMPQRPEGFEPPDLNDGQQRPDGGFGGPGGGMMTANISLINYVRGRVDNIQKQLSGELPTTGNTTMNSGFGPGGGMGRPDKENNRIKVTFNGQQVQMDTQAVIENDRTLVPYRAVCEAMGLAVEWDQENQTVTASKDGTIVKLTIDETTATVNGKPCELEVPAKIVSDRTLVPVRFLAEAFQLSVDWDNDTRTVVITE